MAFLNKYVKGKWILNTSTGQVDVDGDVDFHLKKIEYIPVRFGVVSGNFICYHNKLNSLDGSPHKVGGDFFCYGNQLTSLEKAPRIVDGEFYCEGIKFTSLEGAPKKIGGEFLSNFFVIPKGKWGFEGWMNVLVTVDEKARSLISTILSPSDINKEMKKDPEGMMMKLKGVWNSPGFTSTRKEIVIPDRYRGEMNTLGDLSDLGF